MIVGVIWQPMTTAVILDWRMCTLGYLLTMARPGAHLPGRARLRGAIVITDDEARAIPDDELPPYTILVPAYNEPEVVGDLIGAMAALEYPRDKLQVLLLLEADDDVTIARCQALRASPTRSRIVLVPPAEPRTKPKACNYGLHFATGEIVTIYDAEDVPEPLQLRRVVAAFGATARRRGVRPGKAGLLQRPPEYSHRDGSPPSTRCGSATCCPA